MLLGMGIASRAGQKTFLKHKSMNQSSAELLVAADHRWKAPRWFAQSDTWWWTAVFKLGRFCPFSHRARCVMWVQEHACCCSGGGIGLIGKQATGMNTWIQDPHLCCYWILRLLKWLLLNYCYHFTRIVFYLLFKKRLVFFQSVKAHQTINHFCTPCVINNSILSPNLCVWKCSREALRDRNSREIFLQVNWSSWDGSFYCNI